MPKTIYVICTVARGLFENEFYVTVKGSSAYVDRVNVKVNSVPMSDADEVNGKVVAYLVEEKSGQALVELPGEPVIGGLRAWVPNTDVLAYA
jgi:hypothetical protein